MSVINKMLNDIEQREQAAQQQESCASLDVLVVKEPWPLKNIVLVLLLLLVMGVIIWFNKQLFWPGEAPIHAEAFVPQSQNTALDNQPTRDTNTEAINNKTSAPIQEIASKAPEPTAELINEDVIQPVINKASAQPTAPKPVQSQPSLAGSAVTDEVQKKPKPVTEPELSIKAVALTPHELARLKYQQGVKQQKNGEISKAQQLWLASLRANAGHHAARESLAASYYGANDMPNALAVLELGRIAFPQYEGYRLLMAQIYFTQQQAPQALSVLEQPYLRLSSSNNALELAASIAQHLGRWRDAELNYLPLHQRQSDNAKWLIGLATSLDGQNKSKAALVKYQQFLMLPNGDDALYQYATERIKQLKNLLIRESNG